MTVVLFLKIINDDNDGRSYDMNDENKALINLTNLFVIKLNINLISS